MLLPPPFRSSSSSSDCYPCLSLSSPFILFDLCDFSRFSFYSQIVCGCADGSIQVLYDPEVSTKGILLSLGKAAKKKDVTDFVEYQYAFGRCSHCFCSSYLACSLLLRSFFACSLISQFSPLLECNILFLLCVSRYYCFLILFVLTFVSPCFVVSRLCFLSFSAFCSPFLRDIQNPSLWLTKRQRIKRHMEAKKQREILTKKPQPPAEEGPGKEGHIGTTSMTQYLKSTFIQANALGEDPRAALMKYQSLSESKSSGFRRLAFLF